MNDGDSSTKWKQLLDEVMKETDKAILEKKTLEIETALVLRSQQLHSHGGTEAERNAIKAATRSLLKIKIEKLGFPMDSEFLSGSAGEIQ
jgi:hypothetical protein